MGVPRVSLVIPSSDGFRGGAVPRLLESIDRQTYREHEVLLVKEISPQGRAINEGVRRSRGEYLVIMDDDSRLDGDDVLARLVDCLDRDPRVGMAGTSIAVDPESNRFQRHAARQFPRLNTPDVFEVTESDLACHGCCAIPRRVFDEVGGEREDILRGLDPDLRVRMRAAGYRVVLVPGARIFHPLPGGWLALAKTFFRNGFGSAYAQKFQPDSVYDTHEAVSSDKFEARTSFAYRVARFPARLIAAALRGQAIRLVAYSVYAAGYVYGFVRARRMSPAPNNQGATACTPGNDSRAA
jgi:glycosyltransferase involved in cell wall biosynthesis